MSHDMTSKFQVICLLLGFPCKPVSNMIQGTFLSCFPFQVYNSSLHPGSYYYSNFQVIICFRLSSTSCNKKEKNQ